MSSCRLQAELPGDVWKTVQQELADKKKIREATKKKPRGELLMQFTYSLKDCKFVKANVSEASNLFFQYASSIQEDVSRKYILVQMDDQDQYDDDPGAKRPTRTFFSYDVDERREVILRHGIQVVDLQQEQEQQQQREEEHIVFHLLGCSNSQVRRHCYIFRRSPNLQSNEDLLLQVLPNLLQLERKKGIPKRVKYTGCK